MPFVLSAKATQCCLLNYFPCKIPGFFTEIETFSIFCIVTDKYIFAAEFISTGKQTVEHSLKRRSSAVTVNDYA